MIWDYSGYEGSEVEVERVNLPMYVEEHLHKIAHPITQIPIDEVFGDLRKNEQ